MNVLIKKSTQTFIGGLGVPGNWWPWNTPGGTFIFICCPQCKGLIDVSGKYTILSDGVVTPVVKCPTEHCNWKGDVRLEDWKPNDRDSTVGRG